MTDEELAVAIKDFLDYAAIGDDVVPMVWDYPNGDHREDPFRRRATLEEIDEQLKCWFEQREEG